MLAYWLGGACSYPYVIPPQPPEEMHGGAGRRYEGEFVNYDDEDMAILIPCFITVMEEDR